MPSKKRRNGEGTVYKDRQKNRWVGEVLLRDSIEKPIRRRVSASTEKECLKKLKETISRHEAGARSLDPSMTIEEYAERWVSDVLPTLHLKDSTKTHYRYNCLHFLVPIWGRKKICEMRIADVDTGLIALAERELSKDTVRLTRTMLRILFREAMRDELVVMNPVAESRMPMFKPAEPRRAMDQDQMNALLDTTLGTRMHGPIAIGLTTGLRPGEILALQWQDIDLDSEVPTLQVRVSKTKSGRRIVPLTTLAVDVLREQRAFNIRTARSSDGMWTDEGFVFPSVTGTKWDLSNFRKLFQDACREARLGHWRPHEMRHSAATWMMSKGLPLKVVSDVLGHAHISTTADIYVHQLQPSREVIDAFEAIRTVA
jgi:integrase